MWFLFAGEVVHSTDMHCDSTTHICIPMLGKVMLKTINADIHILCCSVIL
jgi:hypothetical protein